jgi:hypothetical protein
LPIRAQYSICLGTERCSAAPITLASSTSASESFNAIATAASNGLKVAFYNQMKLLTPKMK